MNKDKPKSFIQKFYVIPAVLFAGLLWWCLQDSTMCDIWRGFGYIPSLEAEILRDTLDLTPRGKRLFNATQVSVEESEDFNTHCNSHDIDVALLGCYADGKVYIYNITEEQLRTANQVTTAHELLHAAWERLSATRQVQLEPLLEQVYQDNQTWFEQELNYYDEDDRLEEIYARAGTKSEKLPAELEQHYAKYFRDRGKIVQFYQDYETPFLRLKLEMETLVAEISAARDEIELERINYLADVKLLDAKIADFNACAERPGCFTREAVFNAQKQALLAERSALEEQRTALNQKIIQNNQRIDEYRKKQQSLGELSAAMNSNVEIIEVVE